MIFFVILIVKNYGGAISAPVGQTHLRVAPLEVKIHWNRYFFTPHSIIKVVSILEADYKKDRY